jgi:purine-cytosine permease-like protein
MNIVLGHSSNAAAPGAFITVVLKMGDVKINVRGVYSIQLCFKNQFDVSMKNKFTR